MNTLYKVAGVMLGVMLVALLVFACTDIALSQPQAPVSAVVLDRSYTPRSSTVGTGTNHKGEVVTTVSTEAEKWTVIVQTNEETQAILVSASEWAACQSGVSVEVQFSLGRWTEFKVGWKILRVLPPATSRAPELTSARVPSPAAVEGEEEAA